MRSKEFFVSCERGLASSGGCFTPSGTAMVSAEPCFGSAWTFFVSPAKLAKHPIRTGRPISRYRLPGFPETALFLFLENRSFDLDDPFQISNLFLAGCFFRLWLFSRAEGIEGRGLKRASLFLGETVAVGLLSTSMPLKINNPAMRTKISKTYRAQWILRNETFSPRGSYLPIRVGSCPGCEITFRLRYHGSVLGSVFSTRLVRGLWRPLSNRYRIARLHYSVFDRPQFIPWALESISHPGADP